MEFPATSSLTYINDTIINDALLNPPRGSPWDVVPLPPALPPPPTDVEMKHVPVDKSLLHKPRHERRTFATTTLRVINSRCQYYRKVLNKPLDPSNGKQVRQYKRIQLKFDHDMKVRALLNRAVKHLYE